MRGTAIVLVLLLTAASCATTAAARDTTSTDLETMVKSIIRRNKVAIFSKSYCPYCHRVKALFDNLGTRYNAMELDQAAQGQDIQAILLEMTGQRTVPSVWMNNKFVGGHDDTFALKDNGELAKMLEESD